jgi:hypothetical protein
MANSKYQFKEKNNLSYFPIKNDFINHCQSKFKIYSDGLDKIDRNFNGQYKDLYLEKRKKYQESFKQYFSYDDGVSWFEIKEWKNHRQIIQDLKRTDTYKKNRDNSKNFKKSNSNHSFIYTILIIAVGVFFFVKSQENKSSSQTNTTNSSTNIDAAGQSKEDSKFSHPQIDNSVSEPQNYDDNSYDNNISQTNESSSSAQSNDKNLENKGSKNEMFTCLLCGGSGKEDCSECKGKGKKLCGDCKGLGKKIKRDEYVGCSTCLNSGTVDCERFRDCSGGFLFGTLSCKGSGFVDKETHLKQRDMEKKIETFGNQKVGPLDLLPNL